MVWSCYGAGLVVTKKLSSASVYCRCCMLRAACSVSVTVLLLCFWGPSTALDVCGAPSMLRPRFVLFGDSLTQRSFESGGFGAGLTNAYQRKVIPQPPSLLLI